MSFKCVSSAKNCRLCPVKRRCEVYALVLDLTCKRGVCPLLEVMERCVHDDSSEGYLPKTYEECLKIIGDMVQGEE